jgi:flagellar protein FlaG
MEVSSYTSNIQPYGSHSGTKFASENEQAKASFAQKESNQIDKVAEQSKDVQSNSVEKVVKMAQEREYVNEERRSKMLERMHEFVSSINKGLSFRFDKEAGRDVVTVYEAETGDIIRQIPEEEMLKVLRRLAKEQDHRSGLLMTKV